MPVQKITLKGDCQVGDVWLMIMIGIPGSNTIRGDRVLSGNPSDHRRQNLPIGVSPQDRLGN